VVLPLAISTAAAGLYMSSFLHLPYPMEGPRDTAKSILVYGASSSVGATAVQLAVASGVKVVATASQKNYDFVKTLGATDVLDYKSKSIVEDLVLALKKSGGFAGVYDAVSEPDTIKLCAEVADRLGGGFISCTLSPPEGLPESVGASACKSCSIVIAIFGTLTLQ
jgi:NADPH:quinone reductase-like Zn-dependent oxidoreductase